MRLRGIRVKTGKLPYLPLFVIGLVLGTVFMNYGKKVLLENTGLLDEYTLYHMKYMTVDNTAFFYYLLRQRILDVLLMVIISTTYLGVLFVAGKTIWYGATVGMFISAAVIRYGMKGIFLVLAGVFPQYIIYVPAYILLLNLCEKTCRSIYFKDSSSVDMSTMDLIRSKIIQILIILGAVVIGCVLESYLNPIIFMNLLRIF